MSDIHKRDYGRELEKKKSRRTQKHRASQRRLTAKFKKELAGKKRQEQTAESRAAEQAEQRRHDHLCADRVDDLHIARRNAVVNDGCHQPRDDHFHDDFRDHKDRRQHGYQPKAFCFASECF